VNYTRYYLGPHGGNTSACLTPGIVLGRFHVSDRPAFTVGGGYEIVVTSFHPIDRRGCEKTVRPVFTSHCFAESDRRRAKSGHLHFKSKNVEMSIKPLYYKQLRRYENPTTGQSSAGSIWHNFGTMDWGEPLR
jgi:hypothetical protein